MLLPGSGWRQELGATEPLLTSEGKTNGKLQKGKLKKKCLQYSTKPRVAPGALADGAGKGTEHFHINSLNQELLKCSF